MPGVEYVPQEAVQKNFLTQAEWDHAGEIFYLNFTVKDTGCGLSPEHKAKLFLRFSQATPKTHVQVSNFVLVRGSHIMLLTVSIVWWLRLRPVYLA
jgi:hypothetical protein